MCVGGGGDPLHTKIKMFRRTFGNVKIRKHSSFAEMLWVAVGVGVERYEVGSMSGVSGECLSLRLLDGRGWV